MKIMISGCERGAELAPILDRAAAARSAQNAPADIPAAIGTRALRRAGDESTFLTEYLRLLRYRHGVDTLPFRVPRRPGPLGACQAFWRRALYRLTRFLFDRFAYRQNHINAMLVDAVEFETIERRREIEALRQRVAALEARIGGGHAH